MGFSSTLIYERSPEALELHPRQCLN